MSLTKMLTGLVMVLAVAGPAAAQSRPAAQRKPAASAPNRNASIVSVGFTAMKWVDFEDSTAKGIVVDFSKPIDLGGRPNFSVVGDVTFAKDGDETDTTFGGGLRYALGNGGKARVYVQALAGVIHWSFEEFGDSAFFIAPGAGVTVPVTGKIDVKGQIDFILPMGWEDGNLVRFWFGVAFQVGK